MELITCKSCGTKNSIDETYCTNCYSSLDTDDELDYIDTDEDDRYYIEELETKNLQLKKEKLELENKINSLNEEIKNERLSNEKELKEILLNQNKDLKEKLDDINEETKESLKIQIVKLKGTINALKEEKQQLILKLNETQYKYETLSKKIIKTNKKKRDNFYGKIKKCLLDILNTCRYIIFVLFILGSYSQISTDKIIALKSFIFSLTLCPFIYNFIFNKIEVKIKTKVIIQILVPFVVLIILFT